MKRRHMVVTTGPANITFLNPSKTPERMTDEELGHCVGQLAGHIAERLEKLEPYFRELRERFRKKKSRDATINGCKNWGEYCDKVLGRTKRGMNYFLAGGNPSNEKSQVENISHLEDEPPMETLNIKMIESKPEPPTRMNVVITDEPVKAIDMNVEITEPKGVQLIGVNQTGERIFPAPEQEPEMQDRGEVEDQAFEQVRKLISGLEVFLSFFESDGVNRRFGFADVEPERIRERLTPSEIQTLLNYKVWMERFFYRKKAASG